MESFKSAKEAKFIFDLDVSNFIRLLSAVKRLDVSCNCDIMSNQFYLRFKQPE